MSEVTSDKLAITEIKELRDNGLVIYDSKDLYQISYDPLEGNKGDGDRLWSQHFKQGLYPKVYGEWGHVLEEVFVRHSLNYLRFKKNTLSFDPYKEADSPASRFIRMLNEIDRIATGEVPLEHYRTELTRLNKFPIITYEEQTIFQADKKHRFNEERYRELLDLLWDKREIISPLGVVMYHGKPIKRAEAYHIKRIRDDKALAVVRNGMRKALKDKGINLRLKTPDSDTLYLEVIQK